MVIGSGFGREYGRKFERAEGWNFGKSQDLVLQGSKDVNLKGQ